MVERRTERGRRCCRIVAVMAAPRAGPPPGGGGPLARSGGAGPPRLPWGLRWWELLPELAVAAGLGFFLATETSAATSAFRSGTAIGLMLVVGGAWLAARLALVRFTRWPYLRLALFGLAALGVLWVVVLPAYDDTTVVETLPVA